jgi:hypothetical protein
MYKRGSQAIGTIEAFDKEDGSAYVFRSGYTIVCFPRQYLTVITKEVADIFIAVHNHKEK